MKLRFLSLTLAALLIAGLLPSLHLVFAQSSELAEVGANTGLGDASLLDIIGLIIRILLGILGIIALIIVIYAGFLWMTAGGDEKQIARAKKLLINGIIGLVIILASYAITSFIINALIQATGSDGFGNDNNGTVSVESLSGSLGAGAIQDHYPERNQTDVARNTNIIVTFRYQMDLESFIEGYDTNGTALDVSDDTGGNLINANRIKIYRSADGETAALTNVNVAFSEDLRTFVFDPVDYLGSATENVSYTVHLDKDIMDFGGKKVFTGLNDEGYEWSFETGVNLDLDPPTIVSVVPVAGGTYAKNIIVQVTFDEAIDPTSSTGTRTATSGFQNIQVRGNGGSAQPTAGVYAISNAYKTVTFETTSACGTNSCGETIYCLPGGQSIVAEVKAATVSSSPPQAAGFPYDGIVDVAANSLDGNDDGTAGDGFSWNFTTTNEVFLLGSAIESVTPNIEESNVALDQDISLIFDDVVMSSTINSDNLMLTNKELLSGSSHEQWFTLQTTFLTAAGEEVTSSDMLPAKSLVTMPHGVLLESIDGKTYMYGVETTQGVRNQYQNCYLPAQGPDKTGGSCAVSASAPYCCNGVASATACSLF